MSRRVNKTGRRRSVDAPPEALLERHCPHLAFIEPGRFDRVNALVRMRNAKFKRGKGGVDPRKDVPKKRTRWPGQHLHCGVCGRLYRYGGHGITEHLMCGGAYDYGCWNALTVDGPRAAGKLADAVLGAVSAMPDFDPVFAEVMRVEVERLRAGQEGRLAVLDSRLRTVDRQLANVRMSLRDAGSSRGLIEDLKTLEAEQDRLLGERAELDRVPRQVIAVPPPGELKTLALKAAAGFTRDSPEFGRLMRRLIPRIEVHPYRLCDGGHPVLRAKLTLDLVALVPEARGLEGLSDVLRRELVVDLFEPPQREAFRERVVALRSEGLTERQVAARLGITQPAAQYAAALSREMARRGLSDPYIALTGPPDDYNRLRRHRHPRYKFVPKDAGNG